MNISRLDLSRIACFFVKLLILSFPCIRYAKTNKIDGVKLVRHSNRLKFIVFVVWEKVSVFRDNGKKIGLNGNDSKLIFVKNGTLIWFCAFYSFKTYSNISQWNAKRKRRCLFVIYRTFKNRNSWTCCWCESNAQHDRKQKHILCALLFVWYRDAISSHDFIASVRAECLFFDSV